MKKHFSGFTKKTTSLEYLPQRGPMKNYYMKYWYKNRYKYGVKVDGYNAYEISKRFLKNTLDKDFNSEFSKFCKKYSKYPYFKDRILEKIEPRTNIRKKKQWNSSWDVWFIDDSGILRKEVHYFSGPPPKKTYSVYSDDYKVELRHKITGVKEPEIKKYHGNGRFDKNDYEPVVISGSVTTFDSKNDPKFKRHHYEKISKDRKISRKSKIEYAKKKNYRIVKYKKPEPNYSLLLDLPKTTISPLTMYLTLSIEINKNFKFLAYLDRKNIRKKLRKINKLEINENQN